jgi:adenine-specific DNA methylase
MDCVKFWCGQVGQIDRLKYDKFYKEQSYVREQYQVAAPYLNILSNWQPPEVKAVAKENEQLRSDLNKVTQDLAELSNQFKTAFQKKITD